MSAPLIPARLIPARLRKLIGSFAVMAVLFAWIWAFTSLYDRLPQNRFVHLVYFVVLGMGWVLPVIPMISWMGKADKPLDVGQK
jgi:predicted membrane channel-forming protein YqfA (hemolysin III family)